MFANMKKKSLFVSTALALLSAPAGFTQTDVDESARTLETVVVRGQFIPEPQQNTSQVASFLTSEDLLRQGDANAALALTRLSGLSVVSGKFAYVRGLGDRYSSALLNGSPLPSPEPLRRTVPLDLFPSSVLGGTAVQKTYSADFGGEFGGGVINLETLSAPDEDFFNVKIGSGYNSVTTNNNGIYYFGDDSDWTGYDNGLRSLPSGAAEVINTGQRFADLSDSELETIGESFVNSPISVIQRGDIDPSVSVSADAGKSLYYDGFEIGLIGTVGYENSWTTENAIRQFAQGGQVGTDLRQTETSNNISLNALGTASVARDEHEIKGTYFYVHATNKEAQITQGSDFNLPGSGVKFEESTGWFERELSFYQLAGDHYFGDLEVDWRMSFAETSRDAPYERNLLRLVEDGVPLYSRSNGYGISFTELKDEVFGAGLDLSYLFNIGGGREAVIQVGFDETSSERDYRNVNFRFAGGNSLPLSIQAARPDFLFSADNIDPARFVLQSSSSTADFYVASLDVQAAYAQAEIEFTNFLQGTFGLRHEEGELAVGTFDRFGNPGGGNVNQAEEYVLPAVTLTWNFADDLQFRLGYSETITRPQFRELAESIFIDPNNDRTYRGNSGLVDSELTNYDARLEYYMGRNQFVTAAAFYKEIENPIEEFQFASSTFVFETSFINSPKAEIMGLELEYRTNFDMPFDIDWMLDRDWRFSTNYTYTASEVSAADGELIFEPVTRSFIDAALFGLDGTDLQGTPEHILNVQFGYEGDYDQLTLLMNWVDERILQRGIPTPGQELPDVVEKPGVQLDLVYRRDFSIRGKDVTLSLSGRNLLDTEHQEFQDNGGELGVTQFNTYDRGRSISASLTAKF